MGGAEIFTHEVAKRWVEAGHEVTLFTSKFTGCKKEEISDGVRIVRDGGKYSVYWRAKDHYKKYFSNESFDVVIDEINTRPFQTLRFVNNGEKIIALIHQLAREYWFYEMPFPVSYIGYYYLEKRWLSNYVEIPTVTVSESTRQDLTNWGFKEVFVVPEGLNFEPLVDVPEKESHPVIVYVGRLKRAKRPDHAIKAFQIVKEKIPNAELWIVGNGYFRRDLEKIGVNGVKFFSGLSNKMRREWVKKAWLLVNPSVREGFGLNIVEANALGTPCIAYDVAGLRNAINEETGLIAKPGTIENLARKAIMVLNDKALREKLSLNALNYSRQFSWDKSADDFSKVIQSVSND
jgi:glycosyltransferase involved in cell wall biosynthesis